jgi:hypothetical protein
MRHTRIRFPLQAARADVNDKNARTTRFHIPES